MAIASQYVRGRGVKPPTDVVGKTSVAVTLYVLVTGYEPTLGRDVTSFPANNVDATLPTPDLTQT